MITEKKDNRGGTHHIAGPKGLKARSNISMYKVDSEAAIARFGTLQKFIDCATLAMADIPVVPDANAHNPNRCPVTGAFLF